mmetsp:Transcript_9764/g.41511  ORF Transcript_9764/g.41511 Transcript_9764/m.41511 type:complete len:244 (-) Transcript_9764:11-742(-)
MVTLSVSICAITSSASTASPGDLVSAATAPSVMESPICGTSMSDGGPAAVSGAGAFDAFLAFLPPAAAPASTVHTPWPTVTESPSFTRTSTTVPAAGALTSMVTLSVSICAITSSASTASPGPFKTAAMDPSVMESPIAGTATTSAAAKAMAAARNSRRATSEPTDPSRATRLAVCPSSANEDTTALFLAAWRAAKAAVATWRAPIKVWGTGACAAPNAPSRRLARELARVAMVSRADAHGSL